MHGIRTNYLLFESVSKFETQLRERKKKKKKTPFEKWGDGGTI